LRRHTATAKRPLVLVPAEQPPPGKPQLLVSEQDGHRHVRANGIPSHPVGPFPNAGNPHAIGVQRYQFALPLHPRPAEQITPLHQADRRGPPNWPFGIAVNGILFDPGTAEFWQGDRQANWNYEALSGAVPLGVDANHAHVQPTGAYHYHGLPTGLLQELKLAPPQHSPLVGWAADGFPIYALYGYLDPQFGESKIVELHSSFGLREGQRPDGTDGPGGAYDGAFVQDYQYDAGVGDLDACNGRFCKTPEFPEGTYAYFLTRQWPVIPRAFRGSPVNLRQLPGR
jgi:hypothetical protein